MYSTLTLGFKYLKYLVTAANGKGHGIHSPFVYNFIEKVLNDKLYYPEYLQIEKLRSQLLKSNETINVEDLGAGSYAKDNARVRKIADIARLAAKPRKYAQLLFRIVRYYKYVNLLELGTSLGLTSAYLASASQEGRLLSIEGSPEIAKLAQKNFSQLALNNVRILNGNFDELLNTALSEIVQPDLIFFDGNHRFEPTLRYFKQCLPFAQQETVFIFDDIHWSDEMEQAWKTIQQDEAITCTIDLFFIGLVFFNPAFKEKQHFTIRF